MSEHNNTSVDVIADWQRETFGEDIPTSMTVARAGAELVETMRVIQEKDWLQVTVELADIWITLARGIGETGLNDQDVKAVVTENLPKIAPPPRDGSAAIDLLASLNAWQVVCLQKELKDGEQSAVEPALATYWNIVQLARACGISFGELLEAIVNKMEINRSREWATENGVSQHV